MPLFLGLLVDSACSDALDRTDPIILKTFISPDYLLDLSLEKGRFLGKKLGDEATLPELELTEKNVLSLIHKILPNLPIASDSLVLFPIV